MGASFWGRFVVTDDFEAFVVELRLHFPQGFVVVTDRWMVVGWDWLNMEVNGDVQEQNTCRACPGGAGGGGAAARVRVRNGHFRVSPFSRFSQIAGSC